MFRFCPRRPFSPSHRCTLVLASFVTLLSARPTSAGIGPVIIDNGTIELGVDTHGCLNVFGGAPSAGDGTTTVGLRDIATNYESVAAGTPQEGWGIADLTSGNWAGATSAVGFNSFINLTIAGGGFSGSGTLSESIGNSAFTVHEVGAAVIGPTPELLPPPVMRITHDFHPTPVNRLYEVTVTIENLSASPIAPRYRRMVDWDVEPGLLSTNYVTLRQGPSTAVVASAGNGFQSVDPFDPLVAFSAGPTSAPTRGFVGCPLDVDFTDCGPADIGAAFDFEFPQIPAGGTLRFWLYYGAAPSEAGALAALSAVGASAYSLGQSAAVGTPVTFIFGFKAPWAILDNGTVELGVDMFGALNVWGGTPSAGNIVAPTRGLGPNITGLREVASNSESLAGGDPVEGWGVADLVAPEGAGSVSLVNGPVAGGNLTPADFDVFGSGTLSESVGRRAIVTSAVGNPPILKVTHDFHPSKTANLYEVVVILENVSGAPISPRYRRLADWDIEPTATSELVTIQYGGGSPVVASVDYGFNSPNPLDPMSATGFGCGVNVPFVDCGPSDLGMGMDFELGTIPVGGREQFHLYYGNAPDETAALAALTAVNAQAYSLGQSFLIFAPSPEALSTPTFIFGFKDVLFVDDFETGDRSRWSSSAP